MENEKYYKNKRDKVKEKNRESKDFDFNSSKERKKFKEGLKAEYRSLKRQEKQDIQKFIDDEIDEWENDTEE
jgi:hypothetical protein